MKIIIPMAGIGKRMRPHTLTTPKPLLHVAGKPIVERLVEVLAHLCEEPITEIAFVIGDFGPEVEKKLRDVGKKYADTVHICYQKQALGTAHAVHMAKQCLDGPVIVAFSDTLFEANFSLDKEADGVIWVKQIEDPSQFGVVKLNENNQITGFVEKPQEFVSDLAIIGAYYFKEGQDLRAEIEYLIDNNITKSSEYQLTDALIALQNKGQVFLPGKVDAWMDFGNKNVFVQSVSEILQRWEVPSKEYVIDNASTIIPPVYIGQGVKIEKSTLGPNVSIEEKSTIVNSIISDTVIKKESELINVNLKNSMIGNYVHIDGNQKPSEVSVGDFNHIFIDD